MSVTTLATAAVAKKALENVVDDLYALGKGRLRTTFKTWRAKSKIETLYKKIRDVRFVKTIWQVEKEVDLLKFYYPSKIEYDGKRKTINDLSDFAYDGNIIVQGTTGQGKSIFFRYLTSWELYKGKAIPLFVELRRITKSQSLVAYLIDELLVLGLDVDNKIFECLATNGKLILFLDGFDEVKADKKLKLITQIEALARRFASMRILIASRPHSGIENSPLFRTMPLSPLRGNEYKDVIMKMVYEKKQSLEIISAVEKGKGDVKELLTTPLMVALLVFRYRADQSIPENAIAFYDQLFALLLQRHDKSKPGYIRERTSGLGDSALQDVFATLCFLSRKDEQTTFTARELHKYVKSAIDLSQNKASADKVASDIIEITCLILEEGGDCQFVHKSVQEFYAACFIKEQPDQSAKKFYTAMISRDQSWQQELGFLENIDAYRYKKWFLIPGARRVLNMESDEPLPRRWKTTVEHVVHMFGTTEIMFQHRGMRRMSGYSSHFLVGSSILQAILIALDWDTVCADLESAKIPELATAARATDPADVKYFLLKDVAKGAATGARLIKAIDPFLQDLHQRCCEAKEYVRQVEAKKSVFEF